MDAKKLRYLIACATPGPWRNGTDPCHFDAPEVTDDKTFAYYVPDANNAAYIAALSPDVVTALLDEVERVTQDRDSYANSGFEAQLSYERAENANLRADLAAVEAERNAMRQAAPVMMTVLAWLADEADGRGLREVALHYTEHADHDHLALWLDEYKATRKAGKP